MPRTTRWQSRQLQTWVRSLTYSSSLPSPPLTNENCFMLLVCAYKIFYYSFLCLSLYQLAFQNCEVLLRRAQQNPTDTEFRKQLELSNAICYSIGTNICCPKVEQRKPVTRSNGATWHLPTEDEGCGLTRPSSLSTKVVGGGDSQMGAWPWMALIGYDRYSLSPFRCGGSLITARHVLTAAHCILRDLWVERVSQLRWCSKSNCF